jgi:hypothetical protein
MRTKALRDEVYRQNHQGAFPNSLKFYAPTGCVAGALRRPLFVSWT